MLNTIMKAGGENNEDFRYLLREIKSKLNSQLLLVRHMPYKEANEKLSKEGLDIQSVLKECKQHYRDLHDNRNWPASAHAKDSKAMNQNYGNVNMVATNELHCVVNQLMQNGSNGASRNQRGNRGKGSRGGKPPTQNKKFNSKDKSRRNNPGKKGSGRGSTSPPPPKDSESEIKCIDGVKKCWCTHCNRWTLSHTTDQHKTKEELDAQRTQGNVNMARVNFDFHPTVHMMRYRKKESMNLKQMWLLLLNERRHRAADSCCVVDTGCAGLSLSTP